MAPPLGGAYQALGEQPIKRHRSDEYGQNIGYSQSRRSTSGQDPRLGGAGMAGSFPIQESMSRLPKQTSLPQYYPQGPASAPASSSDYSLRVSPTVRQDSTGYMQYPSGASSQLSFNTASSGYVRSGDSSYEPSQQSVASSPAHGYQSFPTGGSMNPSRGMPYGVGASAQYGTPSSSYASSGLVAPAFQLQSQPYANVPDTAQYSNVQQYRTEQGFQPSLGRHTPSGSLLEQPAVNTLPSLPHRTLQQDPSSAYNLPHQSGDVHQGYGTSFDQPGRPGYPTSTQSEGGWS